MLSFGDTVRIDRLRQWAQELRTTPLPQGKQALRTDDGKYCCLGIAELFAAQEQGIEPVFQDGIGGNLAFPSLATNAWFGCTLAEDVVMPYVLEDADDDEDNGPVSLRLWEANDDYDKSFVEIARGIDDWCDEYERVLALS